MLDLLISEYLDNIDREKSLYAPIAALLRKKGFSNVYITHGTNEKGKDIIAQSDGIQYVLQVKLGRVTTASMHGELTGQLLAAIHTGLSHTGFDAQLRRLVILVTNNQITPQANDMICELSKNGSPTNECRIQTWEKEQLVSEFAEALRTPTNLTLTASALNLESRFYLLLANIKSSLPVMDSLRSLYFLEREDEIDLNHLLLHYAIYTEVIASLIWSRGWLYECYYVRLCHLAKVVETFSHLGSSLTQDQKAYVTDLAQLVCSSALDFTKTSIAVLGEQQTFLELEWSSPMYEYPLLCLRIAECLSLSYLLDESGRSAHIASLADFLTKEPGTTVPVGNDFAPGIALTVLVLLHGDYLQLAEDYVTDLTVSLCELYNSRNGLPISGGGPREGLLVVLGPHLEAFESIGSQPSLVGTVLVELSSIIDDKLHLSVRNDLASSLIRCELSFVEDVSSRMSLASNNHVRWTGSLITLDENYEVAYIDKLPYWNDISHELSDFEKEFSWATCIVSLATRDRCYPECWSSWLS